VISFGGLSASTTIDAPSSTLVASPLGAVKVVADQYSQLLDIGITGLCWPVPQVFALAPPGEAVGLVETGGPFPAFMVVEVGGHGSVGSPGTELEFAL